MKARTKNEKVEGEREILSAAFQKFLDDFAAKHGLRPDALAKARDAAAKPPHPVPSFSGRERNALFRNLGGGAFTDIGTVLGAGCPEDARGVALLDLEGDGDLDLALHNYFRKPAQVLVNHAPRRKEPLVVRLRGTKSNRQGIGARVTVAGHVQWAACGTGYLSQSTGDLHFGVDRGPVKVVVKWPAGAEETFDGRSGARVTCVEGGKAEAKDLAAPRPFDARRPATLRPGDAVPKLGKERRLVGLWSGRCEACRAELEAWRRSKPAVDWRCIDADDDAAKEMLAALKLDLPVALLDAETRSKLGDVVTPMVLGVQDGRVTAKFAGDRALDDAVRWVNAR